MKSENYEICQYLVISYVEAVVKNWVGFIIFLRTMLTNENISEEEWESWEGWIRFGVKVTVEFEFDFESFSTLHIQHVVLHVKIWYNFVFICYI